MTEEQNEVDKHIEDIKKFESDLYDDDEQIKEELLSPRTKQSNKRDLTPRAKLILSVISIFLVLQIIGSLGQIFSLPAIQFLRTSYELSQIQEVQEYKKAIVTIKSDNRKGTGFNITPEGLIITNAHIVEDNPIAYIDFSNGPLYQASVEITVPSKDLAILSIDKNQDVTELPYITLARDKSWGIGDHVYFIGNPLRFSYIANEGEILGEVGSSNLSIPVMAIDAPVYKGNSGSPVIDENGNVIAIVYATGTRTLDNKTKKVGLAVPAYEIISVVKSFQE
ncbi:serine protease [Bacillus sp. HMF5848]|uniref:S1 family peptidase n=1 Tax=Bacillus sp. HMF5848 TaxID=2495421 RepID=UPI000F77BE32|nr:serine protease [Bacillus sp. HMF5848]RSK27239.1 serine protease [Bacillus sp. HMF5848]